MLKRKFVAQITEKPAQVDAKWQVVKEWLLEFEAEFISSVALMIKPAADERKPFDEKYQARDKLITLLESIKPEWAESQMIRCVQALILHRLGTNYYDSEEISMGEKKM